METTPEITLVTGGMGFVGRRLLPILADSGRVRCLVEGKTSISQLRHGHVEYVHGSFLDREALRRALRGCGRVVHLEGVPQESRRVVFRRIDAGTKLLAEEMKNSGVRRLVMLSLVGAEADAPYPFLRAQAGAERCLLASGVPTAILRTTILYGRGDNFVERILDWSRFLPFIPIPVSGARRLQPLHSADLAYALLRMLDEAETGVWEVGGPEILTVDEAVAMVARASDRHGSLVHLPRPLIRASAVVLEAFSRRPPLTLAQVDAFQANHLCPRDSFEKRFGRPARTFEEGLRDFRIRS